MGTAFCLLMQGALREKGIIISIDTNAFEI